MAVSLVYLLLVMNLLPSTLATECSFQRRPNLGGFLTLGGRIKQFPPGQDSLLSPVIVLRTPKLKKFRSSGRIFFWSSRQKYPRRGSVPDVEICPSEGPRPCMDDERPSELDVLPSFEEEVAVTFNNVTSTSLDLSWPAWDASVDRGRVPVAGYAVKYVKSGRIETIDTTEPNANVRDLSPSTEYRFQIAVKAGGIFTGRTGRPTKMFSMKTMCGEPSPPQLGVTSVSSDRAVLDVQVPSRDEWRCDNVTLHLQRKEGGIWTSTGESLDLNTPQQNISIQPCSEYHFRLLIANTVGNASSNEVENTTKPAAPLLPSLSLRATHDTVYVNVNITDFESWECSDPKVTLRRRILGQERTTQKRLRPVTSGVISNTMSGLDSCSDYQFQIRIDSTTYPDINTRTAWTNISTPPEASEMIPIVNVTTNTSTRLAFEWFPARNCTCCEDYITAYEYTLLSGSTQIKVANTTDRSVEFPRLIPFSNYSFRVRVVTTEGDQEYSEFQMRTSEDRPRPPRIARPTKHFVSPTSANVTWLEPSQPYGIIIGYDFSYRLKSASQNWTVVSVLHTYYYLPDLSPYSEYEYKVRAKTSVGYGNWSSIAIFRTRETAPSPPQNIRIVERAQTWMLVSWEPPVRPGGDIKSYEIRYQPIRPSGPGDLKIIKTSYNIFKLNITSLEPSTKYTIQVSAINGAGSGQLVEMTNATKVTTDLTAVEVKEITITGDLEDGFEISLPPLTQKYATNYVIFIILVDGRTGKIPLNGTDPTKYTLTKDKLEIIFGEKIPFDVPPTLQVGVVTDNGVEDPYVVWSNPIPLEPTSNNSYNHLFYLIIMGVFTFSICFIAIVAGSFAIGRAMRKVKDKSGLVPDDSAYLALESRNVEKDSDGRYIPLNIKIPECKEPDQDSIEKVKLDNAKEAAENLASGSSYDEPEIFTRNHGTSSTTLQTFQASTDQTQGSGAVQGTSTQGLGISGCNGVPGVDVTTDGIVCTQGTNNANVAENTAAVKRAVERFKLGVTAPQVYSAGIYDGPRDAQVKTSAHLNKKSSKRSTRASYVDIDNVDNFRRSVSYIEPDDCACTTNSSAYNVIDPEYSPGTVQPGLDKPYIELDEEAMAGCAGIMNREMPSYIELDEEMNGTDGVRKESADHGPLSQDKLDGKATGSEAHSTLAAEDKTNSTAASYIELDEEAMANDSYTKSATDNNNHHSITEPSAASYITLDDEAMLNDSITETKSPQTPLTVLTRQNAQRKKHSYSDTIIQTFGNLPEDKSSSPSQQVSNADTTNSKKVPANKGEDIPSTQAQRDGTNGGPLVARRLNYEKSLPGNPFDVNGAADIYEFDGHTRRPQVINGGKVTASKKKMSYERSFPGNPFITNKASAVYDENVVLSNGGNKDDNSGVTASDVATRVESKQPFLNPTRPPIAKKPNVCTEIKPAVPLGRISYEKSFPGNPFLSHGSSDIIYDDTDVVIEELWPSSNGAIQSQSVNYGNQFTADGAADIYDDAESASMQQGPHVGFNKWEKPKAGSTFMKSTQGRVSDSGLPAEVDELYSNADGMPGIKEVCNQLKEELGGNPGYKKDEGYYDETSLPLGHKEEDPEDLYEEIPAFSSKSKEKPRSLLSLITGKQGKKRNLSNHPGFAVKKNKAVFVSPFEPIREFQDDTYEELPI